MTNNGSLVGYSRGKKTHGYCPKLASFQFSLRLLSLFVLTKMLLQKLTSVVQGLIKVNPF